MRRRSKKARSTQEPTPARPIAELLADGYELTPIPTPMRLLPGELCYADAPVQLLQPGVDPPPSQTHVSGWGVGWPGLVLVSATGRTAPPSPAPKWRVVDTGTLYLTSHRFAVQGAHRWSDLWFHDVRAAEADDDAITLHVAGLPPTRLRVWSPAEYFAVFSWLADRQPRPAAHDAPAG